MLDPFSTLAEAGFSQQAGLITAGAEDGHWTPELIAGLDWLRLAELVRAIAAHSGCELARSMVLEDGSVMFAMLEQVNTPHPRRALVKTAAWNEWGATPETVMRFAREVRTAERARGILVAPGGFSPAALLAAQQHQIEAVGADTLHQVLLSLPSERSDFFFNIATAGECRTPTCPVCLRKLEREDLTSRSRVRETSVIRHMGLVADHVQAESVLIAEGAEANFLHEVRCRELRVAGDATGDFVCEGTVILLPGGMLDGTVAARSLKVEEGGELRGRFRILQGPPQPFVQETSRWQWSCRNTDPKPGCEHVAFEPHGR